MKKQAIVILDPKSEELLFVCDVREFSPQNFMQISKDAKANMRKKLSQIETNKKIERKEHEDEIARLQSQIDCLKGVINYLLGWQEYSEDELKVLLDVESEETINE